MNGFTVTYLLVYQSPISFLPSHPSKHPSLTRSPRRAGNSSAWNSSLINLQWESWNKYLLNELYERINKLSFCSPKQQQKPCKYKKKKKSKSHYYGQIALLMGKGRMSVGNQFHSYKRNQDHGQQLSQAWTDLR